jgi:hypothetical protein
MVGGNSIEGTPAKHSEITQVTDDVWAISYLGSSGYTLTAVLDFASHKLVSFASNEKELSSQHGTFEVMGRAGHAKASAPSKHAAKPAAKATHQTHGSRSHH